MNDENLAVCEMDGDLLFDRLGDLVGTYNKDRGRGMFAHTFFVDEKHCTIEAVRDYTEIHNCSIWETDLSCGHTAEWHYAFEVGMFCPFCGAKVVDDGE